MDNIGTTMYRWASDLFPINRSITGEGVRETLRYIQQIIPELTLHEVPTGTECFDWEVPQEWHIREATLKDDTGTTLVDFKNNNLHVVGYSTAVDTTMSFAELDEHLYYIKELPDAIPYITSYYTKRWGICLSYNQYQTLDRHSMYHVKIDASHFDGSLTYAEVYLPGESEQEIFLSTYICHPSMANNELSGPVVAIALVEYIKSLKNRKYSYRVVFVPETIGSICYISKHLDVLKNNVIAGFNLTTIGDDRLYSFVPSRNGTSLADRAARHLLHHSGEKVIYYSFLDRASDERQYCFPGVDLPVVTICRSKYLEYPEYHTSLDNLDMISPKGLEGGFCIVKDTLELLERNEKYRITTLCEPQLGKRGLYPTLSNKESRQMIIVMMNFITYADGTKDLIEIADTINVDARTLYDIIESLKRVSLLETLEDCNV